MDTAKENSGGTDMRNPPLREISRDLARFGEIWCNGYLAKSHLNLAKSHFHLMDSGGRRTLDRFPHSGLTFPSPPGRSLLDWRFKDASVTFVPEVRGGPVRHDPLHRYKPRFCWRFERFCPLQVRYENCYRGFRKRGGGDPPLRVSVSPWLCSRLPSSPPLWSHFRGDAVTNQCFRAFLHFSAVTKLAFVTAGKVDLDHV